MCFWRVAFRGEKNVNREGAARCTTHRHDYLNVYVSDLDNVIDMEVIRGVNIHIGVDPLGVVIFYLLQLATQTEVEQVSGSR